jgi:hypothetical protein
MSSQGSGMKDTYGRIIYSLGTCPVESSVLLQRIIEAGNGTYGPEDNSVASTLPPSTT